MAKTIAVKGEGFTGIRYREHATRKHGVKFDRYFYIRYHIGGKLKEEGWGWESEGFTATDALAERKAILKAIKSGEEVATLAERRAQAERLRTEKAASEAAELRANITFDAFFESDYKKHREAKVLVTEVILYKYWIKPVIGHKRFSDIGVLDMAKIKKQCLAAGKAKRTIEYCYVVVRNVFNVANACKVYQGAHPVTKAVKKAIQYDNRKQGHLSPEQAEQLLTALKARSEQCHDMAAISLYCGLRAGEVCGLDWSDVHMDNKTLTLRDTKNTHTRIVQMPEQVVKMFSVYQRGTGNQPVFVGSNGERVPGISKTFPRVVADLKLNEGIKDRRYKVTFHTLRHTFASWLVQGGVPLITVQKLMGHQSIRMTERYSHLAPNNMKVAMDIITNIGKAATEAVEKPTEQKVVSFSR